MADYVYKMMQGLIYSVVENFTLFIF